MRKRTIAFWGISGMALLGVTVGVAVGYTHPVATVSARPADAAPVHAPAGARAAPGRLAITRVAHASVLLDFDGAVVLTDPWFTDTEEYRHGEPLGFSLEQLPKLSAVVASHAHYDHFDIDAFAAYPDKSVPFFVGPGMAEAARKAGFTAVRELAPWESGRAGALTVTATPGEHGVPEVTFVLQANGNTVYFGGDSKLIPSLEAELPRRFPVVDLAILAVNGLHAGGNQVVMDDHQAAKLAGELHASVAVPIHYTFRGGIIFDTVALTYHGTAEGFETAAKTLAPLTQVRILPPGQRLEILYDAAIANAAEIHSQD